MSKNKQDKITIPLESVIFDFDGVVVNSEPYYEKAIEEAFADHGIYITDDDWQDFKGLSDTEFWEVFLKKYDFDGDLDELREENSRLLRENMKEITYIPGFRDFFEFVVENFATGLVTSASSHHLNWLFENTAIEDLFKYKVTACDIENTKPHPAPYKKMARMLQVQPNRTAVVEDSVNGIKSAKAAGMITVGLLTSFSSEELKLADFVAKDYQDLNTIFGR